MNSREIDFKSNIQTTSESLSKEFKVPQHCSRICWISRTDSSRSCIWPNQRDMWKNDLQRRERSTSWLEHIIWFHCVPFKDNKPWADEAISPAENMSGSSSERQSHILITICHDDTRWNESFFQLFTFTSKNSNFILSHWDRNQKHKLCYSVMSYNVFNTSHNTH